MEIQNSRNQEEETSTKVSQEPENTSYAPDFDEWIKEKPKREYIRLKTGGPKVMRFKSGRAASMRTHDFGKGPVPIATYLVTTPENPDTEVTFDVTSKRHAAYIKASTIKASMSCS